VEDEEDGEVELEEADEEVALDVDCDVDVVPVEVIVELDCIVAKYAPAAITSMITTTMTTIMDLPIPLERWYGKNFFNYSLRGN
jgi:hypothetical protein